MNRLNVCCGGRILDGYINIDIVAAKGKPPPDVIAPMDRVPLPDGCAEEIMCIHGWEHQFLWECDKTITEWKRLLKPGGKLVLELPDIIKCCENIINGFVVGGKHTDQLGMWGLYGDPRSKDKFMTHRWGWSPKTLREFLKGHGLVEIFDEETVYHPAGRKRRDMRITARKDTL